MACNNNSGHRCEALSGFHKMEFEESSLPDVNEWPHSWPDGEISYRLNNATADISKNRLQHRAVTVALRAWQLRINRLRFRRERNPHKKVDFDVSFEDLDHFDGRKGVFAHAYFPGQGIASGDCHINDEWDWTTHSVLQTLRRPPLVPILIHEFGHSLGLRHDTATRESIMYPSYDMGKRKNTLGPRDIARIQARYGRRGISQRLLDYFINRRIRGFDFR